MTVKSRGHLNLELLTTVAAEGREREMSLLSNLLKTINGIRMIAIIKTRIMTMAINRLKSSHVNHL